MRRKWPLSRRGICLGSAVDGVGNRARDGIIGTRAVSSNDMGYSGLPGGTFWLQLLRSALSASARDGGQVTTN
jgi:hypothetical protein